MNENTTKLIEQLAQKLGTTSAYLWSVLIKQAPIDATITLIQVIIIIITGSVLYKAHKRFCNDDNKISYYNQEEILVFPMFVVAIIWGVFVIASFFCIGDIINGYLNPEYWALHHVLDCLK